MEALSVNSVTELSKSVDAIPDGVFTEPGLLGRMSPNYGHRQYLAENLLVLLILLLGDLVLKGLLALLKFLENSLLPV